ncbi:hypothetical protein M378DRAFT_12563 [Amanita muscaria Koide BX008]|uniref:Uncharacterized protein n=1 Tax=Amanita muscaria (strain Koide BX008) TaxID=946122 RepID=A0A0C2T809_AMAMK|nr:hypothetical protein M378DRAFT_12563 [Amanita muscaria Koide BX008]
MPQKPVERTSSATYGRFSGLTVDAMESATRPPSPVSSLVPKTATVSLIPETPFSYAFLCLRDVFNKKASDEHRAQALYQVFIEIASALETTSQFMNVMTRIAENLGQLNCKPEPCTLHCDKSHNEPCTLSHADPCTLSHADPCTLSHADPCTLPHFFVTPQPCTLEHASTCTLPHNEPCTLQHAEPCTALHIDPCTLSHADPCTLNHFPIEPIAVPIPCPLAHNDPCTLNHFPIEPIAAYNDPGIKEHLPTSRPFLAPPVPEASSPSFPKKTPSSLPLPLAPPPPNTSSIDKVNKRKRFKRKRKHDQIDKISAQLRADRTNNIDVMIARYGSEPEMDSEGFYANPNHGLKDALEDEIISDHAVDDNDYAIRQLHRDYPDFFLDPTAAPKPVSPIASPKPPLFRIPSPTYPTADNFFPRDDIPIPKVALLRAQTEPLPPQIADKTSVPLHAQTSPPELSRNTLTARRCTNKDASPSSFVKFMDVPVTMTREHIHTCLKDNRKWSTVDISNVEIFAIKNKDSTIVNILKIRFKDDAQSTIAKKVLTTSISFGDTISRRCRPWYLSTRSN